MKNTIHRKLRNMKLFRKSFYLYFHEKLDKSFEVIKNVKVLRFEGDCDKLRARSLVVSNLRSDIKGSLFKSGC